MTRKTITQITLPEVAPGGNEVVAVDAQPNPINAPFASPTLAVQASTGGGRSQKQLIALGFMVAFILGVAVLINLPIFGKKASSEAAATTSALSEPITQDLLANGLTDWETWLGRPYHTVDLPGSPAVKEGVNRPALGLDNDPKKVFSLIEMEGVPTLRISGEIPGGISTKSNFEDYHLKLSFRWGEKIWPAMMKTPRDSGILVHSFGSPGSQFGNWMNSIEYQLRKQSNGSLWLLSTKGRVQVYQETLEDSRVRKIFNPLNPPVLSSGNIFTESVISENKEWNTADIYTLGTTVVFAFNGEVTMLVQDAEKNYRGDSFPLGKGKIQLQSDRSEIFFQNISMTPLEAFPSEIQLVVDRADQCARDFRNQAKNLVTSKR